MVKSNQIFVIVATATLCFAFSADLFAPAVAAASDASPARYNPFVEECQKKMTPECGREIFSGMFYDDHPRPESLTKACCIRLVVDMGRPCHDVLFKELLQDPEIKHISNSNKAWLRFRSNQIWDDCVSVAQSPSS